MSVRSTPVTKPQGIGVGCNTTSPFSGSRHYLSSNWVNKGTINLVVWVQAWDGLFVFNLSFMD